MKKTGIKTGITCLSALMALGLAASISKAITSNPISVSAEQSFNTVVSDNFDEASFANGLDPEKWDIAKSATTIAQSDPNVGYLYTNNKNATGDYMFFGTKNKISGITSIEFDYKFEAGSSRWMVLQYLTDGLVSDSYNSSMVYTSGFHFSETYVLPYNEASEKLVKFEAGTGFGIADKIGRTASDWVSIKFDIVDSTHAKLNIKAKDGAYDPANEVNVIDTNPNHSFTDAYVGFQVSAEEYYYYFDNLTIKTSGGDIATDFTDFDVVNGDANFGFVRNKNSLGTYALTEGIINPTSLSFAGSANNDFILSKDDVILDTSISQDVAAVDAEFDLFIPSTSDEKISIVFGVDGENPVLTQNTVVYEIGRTGGLLREYSPMGVLLTDDSKNQNVFSSLSSSKGSKIGIKIFKNGKVSITENGSAVKKADSTIATFETVYSLQGRIAIASSSAFSSTSAVSLDSLKVLAGEYYVPVTKSVTHNFSNSYWGNEGYEDFYLRDPSGATAQTVSGGRLVWAGTSDGTFFGSAHQYDSFILDFKVMSIKANLSTEQTKDSTARNRWIGLDLSRSVKTASEYGTYLMTAIEITKADSSGTPVASLDPWLYTNNVYPQHADLEKIITTKYQSVPGSLFTAIQYSSDSEKSNIKEADAVCFRYISDGNSLTFQLKKASEREFVTYTKYENLVLRDYFTIACTGWTYLEIDDFSMANTSTIYTCADNFVPETIIETEHETIYDKGNVDVNLNDEIAMNVRGLQNFIATSIIIGSVIGVIGLGGIAFGTVVLIKTKKGKKHEKE